MVQSGFGQVPSEDSTEQAKLMEYMQLAQPGPEHAELAKLEGTWDLEVSYWMKPGTEATVMNATGTNKLILGGRFLEMSSDGSFMGMPFQSMYILGFDRRNNEYIASGYDTQGTYSIHASGKKLEDGKTIRVSGSDYDGYWGFTQEYYFDIQIIDENTVIWSVTFTDDTMAQGLDEFKMAEIKYTRSEKE